MIYFIQAGENGPIKIGYTDNDVQQRIAHMQTGCPYELKLLWLMDGDIIQEYSLHRDFEAENIRGEWFHPTQSIFNFINNEGNTREIDLLNQSETIQITEYPGGNVLIECGKASIVYSNSGGFVAVDAWSPEHGKMEVVDANKEV